MSETTNTFARDEFAEPWDDGHVDRAPYVERSLRRAYKVRVCPGCGGQADGDACWHDGDCPNRDKLFAFHEFLVWVPPRVEA